MDADLHLWKAGKYRHTGKDFLTQIDDFKLAHTWAKVDLMPSAIADLQFSFAPFALHSPTALELNIVNGNAVLHLTTSFNDSAIREVVLDDPVYSRRKRR